MTDLHHLDSPINVLWMKYCGIRSEYKMLRDRWTYFNAEYGKVIPLEEKGRTILEIIDDELKEVDRLFEYFKAKSKKPSSPRIYIGGKVRIAEYRELYDRVRAIIDWMNLIKTSFYQRTVSVEIPHYSFGLPRSPERTIGDELLYLAADNVTESYSKCLNTPDLRWDGFVTFVPMLTLSGAVGPGVLLSPTLGVYHIMMPDEQKYLVSSSLMLAHELGHPSLDSNYFMPYVESAYHFRVYLDKEFDRVRVALGNYITEYVRREMENLGLSVVEEDGREAETREDCADCGIPPYVLQENPTLEQILSDIIAFRIGGETTVEVFLDEAFNLFDYLAVSLSPESEHPISVVGTGTINVLHYLLLRFHAVLGYVARMYEGHKNWASGYTHLIDEWAERCGETILEIFEDLDRIYPQEGIPSLEARNRCLKCSCTYGRAIADALVRTGIGRHITDTCVKSNGTFIIRKPEEQAIMESLMNGSTCQDKDPRKILHCAYRLFRKGKSPSYAVVVQSLAYNEFQKRKRKKRQEPK